MCENLSKKPHLTDDITFTRNLILRGIAAIYLVAFLTFYYQSPGKILLNLLYFIYKKYDFIKIKFRNRIKKKNGNTISNRYKCN